MNSAALRHEARAIGLVAQREFFEHLRTRGFWLSLTVLPLILLCAFAIPLAAELIRKDLRFAVTDQSGWVLPALLRQADATDLKHLLAQDKQTHLPPPARRLLEYWSSGSPEPLEQRIARLLDNPEAPPEKAFLEWWRTLAANDMARLVPGTWRARFHLIHAPDHWISPAAARQQLGAKRIFAWIEIPADPVGRPGAPAQASRYTSANLTNHDLREWFGIQLSSLIADRRREEAQVPLVMRDWLAADTRLELRTLDVDGAVRHANTRDLLLQWGPVAFVYVLWVSILLVSHLLLSSTVEEKSGKLVEVLLAATSPLAIMVGKVLGIAAIGLLMVSTWLATFLLAALGLPALLAIPATAGFADLAANPVYLASLLVYYLLGYLFYAMLLSGIGSLCTSLREAQTLAIPIQGALFIPLLAMIPIARDPSGTLAVVLTWLPPFTPFVMMNRAAIPPSLAVYVGTTLLMCLAVIAAAFIGARLFRIGMLTTGQAPGPFTVLRLLWTTTEASTHQTAISRDDDAAR